MKKKGNIIVLGGLILAIVIVVICLVSLGNKKITCTLETELLKGFNNKEVVTFSLDKNGIKKISFDKTISMSDYYVEKKSYQNTLEQLFKNGYSYLKGNISSTEKEVNVKATTTKSGVVLNGVSIKNNSEYEDTSLRFDVLNDLENDKDAFKVGDKYSKKELKTKVERLGFKCK